MTKTKRVSQAPDLEMMEDPWRIFRIMAEFVEGFEVMAPVGHAVTIFGSARTKPEDPYYKAAEETARLLAVFKANADDLDWTLQNDVDFVNQFAARRPTTAARP